MKFKAITKPRPGDPDYFFDCPGCGCYHGVWTTSRNENKAIWSFNGDINSPTVDPSIKVTWQSVKQGEIRCHSFIKAGRIQYLSDSTHSMAGQTVELPEIT